MSSNLPTRPRRADAAMRPMCCCGCWMQAMAGAVAGDERVRVRAVTG